MSGRKEETSKKARRIAPKKEEKDWEGWPLLEEQIFVFLEE